MKRKEQIINWIDKNQNIIILAIIFFFMFLLNHLTPYIADDINYKNIWGTQDRVKNVWDIIISQWKHYFSWGGRSVAHTIAQFFLMLPKTFFDLANSICYVGILAKINSIATNKKQNAWMLVFIHFVLFFIVPAFGEDFLWLIGSCNYAWTIWLVLIFIDYYQKEEKKESISKIIGMFFMGLIAGWSNENVGFALIAMIILYLIYKKKFEKKNIMNGNKSGLSGVIIGYLLLLLAPGNYVRNASTAKEGFFLFRVFKTMITITIDSLNYLWPLFAGLVIIYTYYIYKKKKTDIKGIIFLIDAFIATYVMSVSPEFPLRAWVGIVIFITIAICSLLDPILIKEKLVRFIFYDVIIILSFFFIKDYYSIAQNLRTYNQVIEMREQYIRENPNQEIYYFEKHIIDNKYSPIHGEDLTEDKDYWVNQFQARRYNVPYIIGY